MYIFQTLEWILYAGILPVAMGLAGLYIIYGRDRLPKLLNRSETTHDR